MNIRQCVTSQGNYNKEKDSQEITKTSYKDKILNNVSQTMDTEMNNG